MERQRRQLQALRCTVDMAQMRARNGAPGARAWVGTLTDMPEWC